MSAEEESSVVLDVLTSLVPFGDLGGVKPTLDAEDCVAVVKVTDFWMAITKKA